VPFPVSGRKLSSSFRPHMGLVNSITHPQSTPASTIPASHDRNSKKEQLTNRH